jgi:hypothetical protein
VVVAVSESSSSSWPVVMLGGMQSPDLRPRLVLLPQKKRSVLGNVMENHNSPGNLIMVVAVGMVIVVVAVVVSAGVQLVSTINL